MSLEVTHGGFLSLLQDAGRFGFRHQGMAEGGPADEHAFNWANRLLDNRPGCAAVEVTLGRLELRAAQSTQFALAGADMGVVINDRPAAPWSVHTVEAGERLRFGTARCGLRAYLAVPGGFRVPDRFGSCATVMREHLGGVNGNGQPLQPGDVLPFEVDTARTVRTVPPEFLPDYRSALVLRMLPGYQFRDFPEQSIARFLDAEYIVRQDSDRMGYRLDGPAVEGGPTGIVSEGISLGAVQVPPGGQPIVLLRDRQTIGGYPKLGCVASLDCSRLAQRAPGTRVRFTRGRLEEIAAERLEFDRFFAAPAA